uniref:Uncharacterized protein n=1 Tax=Anguilla anguilla TaxID=7936 RepID=A0A0E9PFF7_ANGAN
MNVTEKSTPLRNNAALVGGGRVKHINQSRLKIWNMQRNEVVAVRKSAPLPL